jgi:hypothetical protein
MEGVHTMEVITEGNVTISTRPDVRIGDESVEDLLRSRSTLRYKADAIEKEILALVSRIQQLTDSQERKQIPIWSGVVCYFPDVWPAVAGVSFAGNEQHNPGQPLHWAREKSNDHMDCAMRHCFDHQHGPLDSDGEYHLAKAIWRLSAELQLTIEKRRAENSKSQKFAAPDFACETLPNGDCVAETECMHGPGVDKTISEFTGRPNIHQHMRELRLRDD